MKNLPSGRTIEDSGDQVMGIYCARAATKERFEEMRNPWDI